VAQANKPGEWVTIDLEHEYDVKAVQVNYTDYKSNLFASDKTVYTQFRMYASTDAKSWTKIADLTGEKRDRPNAYIELPRPFKARYVKYEHVYVGAANLAISDIRIFGNGAGKAPATPRDLRVRRDSDARNAIVSWTPVAGAVGYNVLWGIAKNKLYQTYQRFAYEGDSLEVRALNVGQEYWFAIESFDENGVSKASEPQPGGVQVSGVGLAAPLIRRFAALSREIPRPAKRGEGGRKGRVRGVQISGVGAKAGPSPTGRLSSELMLHQIEHPEHFGD
jgi:xylan 1,4-beta-xylosidase